MEILVSSQERLSAPTGNRSSPRGGPLRLLAGTAAGLLLLSCWSEDGFLGPDDKPKLPPLVRFTGSSVNEGDTALSADRFQHLSAPRIALVWQFMGLKPYMESFSENSVVTEPPYDFSGALEVPPPPEVYQSPEAAIGTFWLFSDKNRNGRLDKLNHPALKARLAELDTLQATYLATLDRLAEISEEREAREAVVDTYFVGQQGAVLRANLDTIWPASPANGSSLWWLIVDHRSTILSRLNKWEDFFQRRKPSDATLRAREHENFALRLEYSYFRKVFPLPGQDGLFERRLAEALQAYFRYYGAGRALEADRTLQGWADYPYLNFSAPGEDWVAGRSRWYYVVYLPDQKNLRDIKAAEAYSNYRVEGIENARLGYNLIHCTVRRDCSMVPWTFPVTIDLGETEAYFNSPTPEVPFITAPVPLATPPASLAPFEGSYEYLVGAPVRVLVVDGNLWVGIKGLGTFRMLQADSVTFFSPVEDLQLRFAPTVGTPNGKVLMLSRGLQTSAKRLPADTSYRDLRAVIEAVRSAGTAQRPLSRDLEGRYDYGADTASLQIAEAGDSARLVLAGLSVPLTGSAPNRLAGAWSDLNAEEIRNENGDVKGIGLFRNDRTLYLPKLEYAPRLPPQLFGPGTADSAWSALRGDGTGVTTHRNVSGADGYACSTDGLFLKPGDGVLDALDRAVISDSVSWTSGDKVTFRLHARAGKRVVLRLKACMAPRINCATTAVNCADRVIRARKVLLSARAGASRDTLALLVADEHWLPVSAEGNAWSLGPFPAPADSFFLTLTSRTTAHPESRVAFDNYELLVEP